VKNKAADILGLDLGRRKKPFTVDGEAEAMSTTAQSGLATVERRLNVGGHHFSLTPTGLLVAGEPSLQRWKHVGGILAGMQGAMRWWIGDWLAYGAGRGEWGDMYGDAVAETGLSQDTLKHCKSLSCRIELCRRRHNLSWKHHQTTAALPDEQADAWLDRAERDGLSVAKLRKQIKEHGPECPADTAPADGGEADGGAMYDQAVKETGLSDSTLANCKSLSDRVEFSRRRENLSWKHHDTVAALPDEQADAWLDRAERDGLSVAKLRKQIKEHGPECPADTPIDDAREPDGAGADDDSPDGAGPPPARGLELACEAINALSRIPKTDRLRGEGLDMVADWIDDHR